MAQSVNLKARGLYTLQNSLSGIPEGSLSSAENIVIDRDGVIEPRRGIKIYGDVIIGEDSLERAKQFITYKERVLRHYSTKLQVDNGSGTFTTLNDETGGEASIISPEGRIRAVEQNGNLYFTSTDGIRKISATSADNIASSQVTRAGIPKALDLSLTLSSAGTPVLLDAGDYARYRVTWLFRDANSVLLEGSPSAASVIFNDSGTPGIFRDVSIQFSIPEGITTNHAYRIYRSDIQATEPDDELQLVYEANPTSGEITAKRVNPILDINTVLTGTNLYTNPNSEQGILQSNDPPPLATDIAVFKGTTFYSNTTSSHKLELSTLGVGETLNVIPNSAAGFTSISLSAQGATTATTKITVGDISNISVGGKIRVVDATSGFIPDGEYTVLSIVGLIVEINATFTSAVSAGTVVKVKPSATAETYSHLTIHNGITNISNIVTSGLNIVITVASSTGIAENDVIYINDVSSETTAAGAYTVLTVVGNAITVVGTSSGYVSGGTVSLYNPRERYYFMDNTEYPSIGIFNRPTAPTVPLIEDQIADFTQSAIRTINRAVNGICYAYAIDDPTATVSGQFYLEGRTLDTPKFYVYASDADTGDQFIPVIPVEVSSLSSDNSTAPNRLYYSKLQQPESVPAINYQDIGPRDKAILRIAALRDSLFIFKEDGVYRLSGDNSNNFSISLFDSNITIAASDSVASLNNQIYLYSDQGIAAISDTGATIVSRDIENVIIPKTSYANFAQATFAFGYENDRSYLMFTVQEDGDEWATICYRLNTFTRTWTTLLLSKRCGIVVGNRMYLGADDVPYIEQERKSLTRLDYADREYTVDPPAGFVDGTRLYILDVTNTEEGDVLTQDQGVTISQYNRLLKLLDLDGASDDDYFETLEAVPGDSMRDKIVQLSNKLNADVLVTATDYPLPLISEDEITDHVTYFNEIVGKLNDDIALSLRYHVASSASFEARIASVDQATGSVVVDNAFDFIAVPMTLFKAIPSSVTYAPQHFGDPSILKHIYETTVLFEDITFSAAEMAYATDVSSGFIPVAFEGEGKGLWGSFAWGRANWGGVGSARPFRTYMPKGKQRARYVMPRFSHSSALEKYSIFGISFTFEVTSSRGYR